MFNLKLQKHRSEFAWEKVNEPKICIYIYTYNIDRFLVSLKQKKRHMKKNNVIVCCFWIRTLVYVYIYIKRLGLVSRPMNYCELRIIECISCSNLVMGMYNIHAYIRHYISMRIVWLSNERYLSTIYLHDYVHFSVLSSLLYKTEISSLAKFLTTWSQCAGGE